MHHILIWMLAPIDLGRTIEPNYTPQLQIANKHPPTKGRADWAKRVPAWYLVLFTARTVPVRYCSMQAHPVFLAIKYFRYFYKL